MGTATSSGLFQKQSAKRLLLLRSHHASMNRLLCGNNHHTYKDTCNFKFCAVLSWIPPTTFVTTRNPPSPIPPTNWMQPEDKGSRPESSPRPQRGQIERKMV
ncbi:hypothetical protein TNCV_4796061 [Trichonephila clavipes]|nr:hypothetical protein TNCV_4796061 [Trichonephila clavipes]